MNLADKLGLTSEMSTYYLRAPQEYWQVLGTKQEPYDDNTGEYDFIHAFFTSKDEMSNFADILISKLSHDGILWISWPKSSEDSDMITDISEQSITGLFTPLGLIEVKTTDVTDSWLGIKFIWANS